jgi:hypothetical protein
VLSLNPFYRCKKKGWGVADAAGFLKAESLQGGKKSHACMEVLLTKQRRRSLQMAKTKMPMSFSIRYAKAAQNTGSKPMQKYVYTDISESPIS